mmetsp:Transcript_62428/g.197142  ORF Transcript_62428/g.197142 Transcript_62428/m.197142 type:complete len:260 (-) Transcript_62428:362-1141(-)
MHGPGVLRVAPLAEVHHGGPGLGDDPAAPRALQGRGDVEALAAVSHGDVREAPERGVPEGHDADAFRRIPVLVDVHGDGRHARDPEVPRLVWPRQLLLVHVRQEDAAQAVVDVQADSPGHGQLRQVFDVVNDAVREGGRRGINAHDVAGEVWPYSTHRQGKTSGKAHGDLCEFHAEVVASLDNGRVASVGRQNARRCDATLPAQLAVRQGSDEHRLRAPGRQDAAAGLWVSAQEVDHPTDQLCLEFANRREDPLVQGVG